MNRMKNSWQVILLGQAKYINKAQLASTQQVSKNRRAHLSNLAPHINAFKVYGRLCFLSTCITRIHGWPCDCDGLTLGLCWLQADWWLTWKVRTDMLKVHTARVCCKQDQLKNVGSWMCGDFHHLHHWLATLRVFETLKPYQIGLDWTRWAT